MAAKTYRELLAEWAARAKYKRTEAYPLGNSLGGVVLFHEAQAIEQCAADLAGVMGQTGAGVYDGIQFGDGGPRHDPAVAENLATLNELVAEMLPGLADEDFLRVTVATLRNHSHRLGFDFQGDPPPGDPPFTTTPGRPEREDT